MFVSVPRVRNKRILASFSVVVPMLFLVLSTLWATQADAQVPRRYFVNSSFEIPDLDVACGAGGTTWRPVDALIVPDWETTHSLWSPGNACGGPTPYRAIEFWESGFLGVASQDGTQHVELNANESSRIYQSSCLLANEQINYSYYHRSRQGNPEISRAVLYDDTGATLLDQGPNDAVNVADGWVLHTGTLTNNGVTAPRQMGFVSVNSGSFGNFLDLAEFNLAALIEILPVTDVPAVEDAGTPVMLGFQVNGTLDSPATFTLTLDGASTANTADFSVTPGPLADRGTIDSYSVLDGTITITLPAGIYDPNESDNTNGVQGEFAIPINYTVDALVEAAERIIYNPGSVLAGGGSIPARDLQFNDSDCDGDQTASASYLITNDDVDITLTKTLVTPRPYLVGQEVLYTLVVGNLNPLAATATNILVSDTPTNLTITLVSSPGCAALPCTIASLAPGASESIQVTATVNGLGDFLNTASATADQPDGNLANNSDNGSDGNNGGYLPPEEVPAGFLWSLLLMVFGVALVGSGNLGRRR